MSLAASYGPARRAGFSMVELLAATAISGMLIVGVVAVFLSWRNSAAFADESSQTLQRGERAFSEITSAIRSAGFGGCAQQPALASSSIATDNDPRWDFLDGAIRGYDGKGDTWKPTFGDALAPGALARHDVILLRYPKPHSEPLRLQTKMRNPEDDLRVQAPPARSTLRVGDLAMIASCEARAFFVATSSSDEHIAHRRGEIRDGAPTNLSDSLDFEFDAGAEVFPLQTTLYYVAPSPAADGSLSLWRRTGADEPEEIASHVRDLQLDYGVDLDNDKSVDEYRAADAIADWGDVYSVRVSLQLDAVTQKERGTSEPGRPPAAPSQRSSNTVFQSTVAIRNRVPRNG